MDQVEEVSHGKVSSFVGSRIGSPYPPEPQKR